MKESTFDGLVVVCATLVVLAVIAAVSVYNLQNNFEWYRAYTKCVVYDGVPGNFPVLGNDGTQFTCIPRDEYRR